MRIPRIYTPLTLEKNSTICLDANASAHIRDVLRLKINAKVLLFNGNGYDFSGVIASQSKKKLEISIIDAQQVTNESSLEVHLLQPLCRAEKMDWCIQKATELGVKKISPVICKHNNVKLADNRIEKKLAHWQSVIHSACEQSGRAIVPTIEAPQPLANTLSSIPTESSLRIISSPGATQNISELANPATHCICLIGPEGGFSEDELSLASNYNFEPISLGPRILRLETAVITTLSIAQATWGDLN